MMNNQKYIIMNTKVKNILKHWKKSIERYNKIDEWNFSENVSVLSRYIRNNENNGSKDLKGLSSVRFVITFSAPILTWNRSCRL